MKCEMITHKWYAFPSYAIQIAHHQDSTDKACLRYYIGGSLLQMEINIF